MPAPSKDPIARSRGRGRKPKATAIVPAEGAAPLMPADLPDEAREMYRVALDELVPRGLRAADLEAIRQMCLAAHYAREAERHIAAHGVVMDTELGPKVNPMLKVHRDETAVYMRIANEYGLTIASRLRLGLMHLAGQSVLAGISAEIGLTVKV